jgi:hypothetical protein
MRILLAVLLAAVATSAQADWVKVTETGDTVYYVDPATLVRDGGLRKVEEIQDYAMPRAGGARSRRLTFEFDCSGERWRVLSVADHEEAMARGRILGSWQGQSEWNSIAPKTGTNLPPSTTGRTILRYVCSL